MRTRFVIVADAVRRAEWGDKMSAAAFRPLRNRVEFWDYEAVAKRHAVAAEHASF